MRIAILYSYNEKSKTRVDTLKYFFQFGYTENPDIFHLLIVNGGSVLKERRDPNAHIIKRDNKGFDFGAWGFGLDYLSQNNLSFDYYVFLNDSARGPFTAPYYTEHWSTPYIRLLKDDVKIVGSTLNILRVCEETIELYPSLRDYERGILPSIQSYIFAMDKDMMEWLKVRDIFTVEDDEVKNDLVEKHELRMSRITLENGWNIACILKEYAGMDFRKITEDPNKDTESTYGDPLYLSRKYFGRDLHPYEMIFVKTNRGICKEFLYFTDYMD